MKKFLFTVLALLIVFCFAGCNTTNHQNTVENEDKHTISNSELKTTEDDFWEYLAALYGNYDILEASKYSFFDVENIYEDVIVETSNSLGISTERLYVNIQYRLNDSNVNDYQSFMKAYAVAMNKEDPVDKSAISSELSEMKRIHKVSNLNDSEIIDLKKYVYQQCDSLKESRSIDVSKYIVFDDVTEYKAITIQEELTEEEKEDGVQHPIQIYYIVNTTNGWKVLDLNIISSLQIINEEIWNIYD